MSDLQEVLESTFDPHIDPEVEEAKEPEQRFRIQDERQAEWALRKLARFFKQQRANHELAEAEISRIREWLTQQNGRLEVQAQFFEALLVEFHRHELNADPRRKTISLPVGSLKARKSPDSWIFDDAAFIEWAKSSEDTADFVRIKQEVNRQLAKQKLEVHDGKVVDPKTGEVVTCVQIEPGGIRFSVEVTP